MVWAALAPDEEVYWQLSIVALLSVPALVFLNGFFVAAEFALVAVRRTRVQEMVDQGVQGAIAVQDITSHLDRSIAATQLGITLASIALGWVSEPALARLVAPLFSGLPVGWGSPASHTVATILAFALITFMHVVFGELIPKTLALQSPDTTALWVARPFNVFVKLSRPIIIVMNGTGNSILRWLGYPPATGAQMVHSVDELTLLIEDTQEAGILDPDSAGIVQNAFRLSDKTVADCMVPRSEMGALELKTPEDKVLEAVRRGAHTRMPVYDTELDNIVGIVNTKDLFYLFSLRGVVVLEDALYPAIFLYPQETVANALRLFRKARKPMAVVRDEEGHVKGLITLEDIVEQIVGDIEDEHDAPIRRGKLTTEAQRHREKESKN